MKIFLFLLGIFTVFLALWIAGSIYIIHGLETPEYEVIEQNSGYEIRKYQPYLVAEVEVYGEYNGAMRSGFQVLANYIFGGNTTKESLAMTTPVSEMMQQSESISMTTPVSEFGDMKKRIVQFSLPSKYTLKNLPIPNNDAVILREQPGFTAAVLRYSWYATEKRVEKKTQLLLKYLEKNGEKISGETVSSQYNPPLSFPALRRNEIIIMLEK